MSTSSTPAAVKAEQGPGQALDLIGKIVRIGSHGDPRVVAQLLASLAPEERQELDRLLAKLIQGLSSR
ncbi:hypothetical protein IP92_00353 [Pseudoduganella flava]|uniref:Transcriptional regulator n=1 Tax=Pseudoduganella flava TaxID=871742 RepID=A0A562Q3N6_9BURK|nr:hypothetical protein [Pseudoduganella flava]QGZ41416.1 hypothetical protein GO485_21695 [Pseudoduganella flava]TWI51369.1 hypothetical protein IP92_00353 [Pseudoduganella flava]